MGPDDSWCIKMSRLPEEQFPPVETQHPRGEWDYFRRGGL